MPSCRQSIAAVKRLLREVFADQLAIKQRLDKLESSTATELEAADDYQLAVLGMNSSAINSQGRSPVRITGGFMATGLLPWSQVCYSGLLHLICTDVCCLVRRSAMCAYYTPQAMRLH